MKVTLIASTHLEGELFKLAEPYSDEFLDAFGGVTHRFGDRTEYWMETDQEAADADTLAEFAGRACYQSFHKPNPKTADNAAYLANILAQQHESVLEHASATFYVTGVSRALTHELIRHRHLSYSELSQRFVNVEDADMVYPPAVEFAEADAIADVRDLSRQAYSVIVKNLTERGLTRKQAREAARAVMPNATETRIVVTGNMRAWRDVLRKRYSVHADAEIREFATEVLRQLKQLAPGTFQDFPAHPFGSDK